MKCNDHSDYPASVLLPDQSKAALAERTDSAAKSGIVFLLEICKNLCHDRRNLLFRKCLFIRLENDPQRQALLISSYTITFIYIENLYIPDDCFLVQTPLAENGFNEVSCRYASFQYKCDIPVNRRLF